MKKKLIIVIAMLAVIALTVALLAGCGDESADNESNEPDSITVTDLAGREVEIAAPVERVTAIGPGALRLICYTGDADKVVGIENMELQWGTGRPYIMANPELLDLPIIGQGGPDSTPDPEMLITVDPDVIFAAYLVDAAKADELQSKTGIPVVVLSYGALGTFDEEVFASIEIIGEITGSDQRAQEVSDYIRSCQDELDERTADIPESDKPTVYVGGLGMKGTHGIESTQADYPPLDSINALNVVDETGASGSVMIDKEQLLEWDPDIIFLDESGYGMVVEDYRSNPGLYDSLQALKEGNFYGYLPFNYYATNIDTAIADSYFMGKIMFPDAFEDIDPVEKADEIYEFLLGTAMYEQMARDFGGFVQLDPSSE
ncbi:MAG: iron ABC transporter substrate-binding protein [Actinobacteria bacterium]|nr:iron ABC transporter substrate-binding protein [Actinomycetota bacterium]